MATIMIHDKTYKIKIDRYGQQFVEVHVDDLQPGMLLDQGVYAATEPGTFRGELNPNTWTIRLADGLGYIESRGAHVRVWL